MMFSFAFVLMAVVFFLQLLLCRMGKRRWLRWIPPVLIIMGEIACVAAYGLSVYLEQTGKDVFGAAFAAVIYGILLLYLLAADVLAWAVSAIVRFVQKRKNNLQCKEKILDTGM